MATLEPLKHDEVPAWVWEFIGDPELGVGKESRMPIVPLLEGAWKNYNVKFTQKPEIEAGMGVDFYNGQKSWLWVHDNSEVPPDVWEYDGAVRSQYAIRIIKSLIVVRVIVSESINPGVIRTRVDITAFGMPRPGMPKSKPIRIV